MEAPRATTVSFEAEFLDTDGDPMLSADASAYPAVIVKDPTGLTVANGVGRPIGSGKYLFNWFVPEDAEINVIDRPWRIEWFFVSAAGHNDGSEELFNVVEKVDPKPEERKWTYITRVGTGERLFLRLPKKPEELSLQLLDTGDREMFTKEGCTQDYGKTKESIPIAQRKIGYTTNNGDYVFHFNTDPLNYGEYLVFWRVRETTISPADDVQQLLRVPEMNFWRLAQPLRMLIDKLQKRVGWIQSYSDSDLYEYIIRGVDMTNLVAPSTNWSLGSLPLHFSRGIIDIVLLYAAMWGLTAQQVLEIELSFDHGGQTVQLNYNHDYGSVFSQIENMLARFIESKPLIYRLAEGPGRVGVRPKNWRFSQRVWRVDGWGTGSPYDVSTLMTSVGLG